jgi:hypothetical protein
MFGHCLSFKFSACAERTASYIDTINMRQSAGNEFISSDDDNVIRILPRNWLLSRVYYTCFSVLGRLNDCELTFIIAARGFFFTYHTPMPPRICPSLSLSRERVSMLSAVTTAAHCVCCGVRDKNKRLICAIFPILTSMTAEWLDL